MFGQILEELHEKGSRLSFWSVLMTERTLADILLEDRGVTARRSSLIKSWKHASARIEKAGGECLTTP
ncbi:hypothetical protein L2E82_02390 [Cichorium intybus]|uniref:Uncharacterized protein n=1 Tax=Cichorium intybus TaxID=13427 RepID=A0ACB9H355_CICIN|nr:hypothetical protein L2E82_02390 [Cichorium intybus]